MSGLNLKLLSEAVYPDKTQLPVLTLTLRDAILVKIGLDPRQNVNNPVDTTKGSS